VHVAHRGFGFKNALKALHKFVSASKQRHVVFGTSEICLYSLFSHRQDIWVFTGLGRLLLDEGLVARAIRSFLRVMYRGQKIVVLNPEDRLIIQQSLGAPANIINGEGYVFRSSFSSRSSCETSTGLTFAYVGRLLKSKGVDRLVADFARHSNPSWTLLVIGDSDFSNPDSVPTGYLHNCAQSSKGRIVYTGFQQDVHVALESVDFLISLSRREGLPFSVLDGIASGAHLVLSPVPGHLSFSGLPGVTFVEPEALGRFFEKTGCDLHKLLTFDRAARQTACARKFGEDVIVESIKQLFKLHS
jgi:glycosyltransferase involved in cell wall biosynthesis